MPRGGLMTPERARAEGGLIGGRYFLPQPELTPIRTPVAPTRVVSAPERPPGRSRMELYMDGTIYEPEPLHLNELGLPVGAGLQLRDGRRFRSE